MSRPGRGALASHGVAERQRTTGPGWRGALGDGRVLVSGFGKWGGGLYDLTSGVPEALDDLPTSGLAVGGGRLWRVLRAPGEQTSTCELMSYDARGVRSYERHDGIRDPHDVRWHDGAPHVTSSWDNAVWRVDPGCDEPRLVWQGSAVPDGWHVNSLVEVDGALHVCAFGRFERHKQWKDDHNDGRGFVHDLRAGRDVLTGLAHPHTPRRRGPHWYVCESSTGLLTELGANGTLLRRVAVNRFSRGLAFAGPFALVGGNAHRKDENDRGEIVVVDLRTFAVVERIPMPCLEIYDILLAGPGIVRGVATGFGTNAARTVDQHRSAARSDGRRPTPADAAVLLVPPRTAAALAAAGDLLGDGDAARCGVRGALPAVAHAGEVTSWSVEVVNRTDRPLATVPLRPVKIGARWFRLPDGDGPEADPGEAEPGSGADADAAPGAEPVGNPLGPIPRILPPGMRTAVAVPVEVPGAPGRYEVRIALRQPGRGWFGVRLQAEVTVKADG